MVIDAVVKHCAFLNMIGTKLPNFLYPFLVFSVALNASQCEVNGSHAFTLCERSCQKCGGIVPPEYDLKKVPKALQRVAFLIGKWKSEFGGKAFFPTIPKFTYGEEIDIKMTHHIVQPPTLNYTAFAWDASDENITELHSESGYIAPKLSPQNFTQYYLTTAMSNGFMTVESGEVGENAIKFRLRKIGRISFSHDSAVRLMFREWTLLDENRLEARLLMTTTVTRHLMEHTSIIYKRIFEY
ncbi:unnamed protein product, partial [Mesorhabditis belari]|uniref:THAP4-like heme-binding domain-containing protein n=1 Tax=Mesorhabditis belari TaxID=2138241 RepID=A0AAF3E864_9BILA